MTQPSPSTPPLIDAVGLTKCFVGRRSWFGRSRMPDRLAVDGVDLALADREVFGLVGPNGAGKTTLIKLLTTLLRPSSGTAHIAGLDVVADERAVRRVIGLVTSNERSFYWRLTGRQNLDFFAQLYELDRREARRWIDELLDLLDLTEQADDRFDGYSTGMKQRLAFARGLLCRPRFLFMDEPTKGVDPVAAAELVRILRERVIERWKPTILITSHNLSEIEKLCGRIALMNNGRFIAVGTLDELRSLAHPVERFELVLRNVTATDIASCASGADAVGAPQFEARDQAGLTEVALEFELDSTGFSRFTRAIIERGGDLVTASSVRDSFDTVFQKLVRAASGEGQPARNGDPNSPPLQVEVQAREERGLHGLEASQ